jgi:hypothetical protein
VAIVVTHTKFDPLTFEYDLALLRFHEPVSFQPNIIPVCLPPAEKKFVGNVAWVTGWGRLYEGQLDSHTSENIGRTEKKTQTSSSQNVNKCVE